MKTRFKSSKIKSSKWPDKEDKHVESVRSYYSKQLEKYESDLNETRNQRNSYKAAMTVLVSSSKITAENKDSLNSAIADMTKEGASIITTVLRNARSLSNIKTMDDAIKYFNSRYFEVPSAAMLDTFTDYVKEYSIERKKIGKVDDRAINKMDIDVCMFFGENIGRINDCARIYTNIANILEKDSR